MKEKAKPRGYCAELSPEEIDEMLAKLATGKYRRGTVSAAMGQTRHAFYMREKRDPEFAARVEQAMAQGEMALCDDLYDAKDLDEGKKSSDSNVLTWMLERIHHVNRDIDEARIREIDARAESGDDDLARQKALRDFLRAAMDEAEGDPNATAEDPA